MSLVGRGQGGGAVKRKAKEAGLQGKLVAGLAEVIILQQSSEEKVKLEKQGPLETAVKVRWLIVYPTW